LRDIDKPLKLLSVLEYFNFDVLNTMYASEVGNMSNYDLRGPAGKVSILPSSYFCISEVLRLGEKVNKLAIPSFLHPIIIQMPFHPEQCAVFIGSTVNHVGQVDGKPRL
jgi:hypothetical protein